MRMSGALAGIALALLVGACSRSDEALAPSPTTPATYLVPATEARPYSVELPTGWTLEETIHSDGSSFVTGPIDDTGTSDSGGKLYGVLAPSGRVLRFEPAPTNSEIHSMESDGSKVEVDQATSIDGYPGWEILSRAQDGRGVTLIAAAEVARDAGISLVLSTTDPRVDVEALRAIVASVQVDKRLLDAALNGA
jgi:hypothetical protein